MHDICRWQNKREKTETKIQCAQTSATVHQHSTALCNKTTGLLLICIWTRVMFSKHSVHLPNCSSDDVAHQWSHTGWQPPKWERKREQRPKERDSMHQRPLTCISECSICPLPTCSGDGILCIFCVQQSHSCKDERKRPQLNGEDKMYFSCADYFVHLL